MSYTATRRVDAVTVALMSAPEAASLVVVFGVVGLATLWLRRHRSDLRKNTQGSWSDVVRTGPVRIESPPSPAEWGAPSPLPTPDFPALTALGAALDYELGRLRELLSEIERQRAGLTVASSRS